MSIDIRLEAARFYDNNPGTPDDLPFYQALLPSPDCSILELGCGTGRVMLPLIPCCHNILGIDNSSAMLSICRQKLAASAIPLHKAQVVEGDITGFTLGRKFDFIIAPFRVLQNLETDAEVDGLFRCIHQHLAPHGTCILNVFQPMYDLDTLRREMGHSRRENGMGIASRRRQNHLFFSPCAYGPRALCSLSGADLPYFHRRSASLKKSF